VCVCVCLWMAVGHLLLGTHIKHVFILLARKFCQLLNWLTISCLALCDSLSPSSESKNYSIIQVQLHSRLTASDNAAYEWQNVRTMYYLLIYNLYCTNVYTFIHVPHFRVLAATKAGKMNCFSLTDKTAQPKRIKNPTATTTQNIHKIKNATATKLLNKMR